MKKHNKLFATIYNYSLSHAEATEVADLAEAERISRTQRALYFTLHDQTVVEIDGVLYQGEENRRPGTHYVGVDRLYSRDEVIKNLESMSDSVTAHMNAFNKNIMRNAILTVISHFRNDPPDAAYIVDRAGREGEYVRLKTDDSAFDRNGARLWPSGTSSAPTPAGGGYTITRHI